MATTAARIVSAVSESSAVGFLYSMSVLPFFLGGPSTGPCDCGTSSVSEFSIRDLGPFPQPRIADISDNSQSIVSLYL